MVDEKLKELAEGLKNFGDKDANNEKSRKKKTGGKGRKKKQA